MNDIKIHDLNDEQATTIIVEGMNRGLCEHLPVDPRDRMKDATDLVAAAIRANRAGNKSDNVLAILFIAQVDQKPPQQKIKEEVLSDTRFDLEGVSDKILDALIEGLDKYVETPNVETQRAEFMAEKARRSNGKVVEEVPQNAAQEAPQEAGSKQLSSEGMQGSRQIQSEGLGESGSGSTQTSISSGPISTAEDAGAFAGVQTSEESGKGGDSSPESSEEDSSSITKIETEERNTYMSKINLEMVEAHGVDPLKVESLPFSKLEFIVNNPKGPPAGDNKEEDMESKLSEAKSVAGMDMNATADTKIISKDDIEIEQETHVVANNPDDREKLEEQLTGPILKAYGQGRKSVPNIGNNELRLMIENPTAKITPGQLEKVRELDGNNISMKTVADNAEKMIVTEEVIGDPIESSFIEETPAQKMLKEAEAAVAKEQKEKEDDEANIKVEKEVKELKEEETLAQAAKRITDEQDLIVDSHAEKELNKSQESADKIISHENLPIPPDISGNPPILPNDISKCSIDEIYSLHARFHAVESRTNWVIFGYEDELSDIEKLKRDKEAKIYADIPTEIDGRRTTNDYRDSIVAADDQVLSYKTEEHDKLKIVNKLRVLQKNYHLDCERLSRQMSKWEREKNDGPR